MNKIYLSIIFMIIQTLCSVVFAESFNDEPYFKMPNEGAIFESIKEWDLYYYLPPVSKVVDATSMSKSVQVANFHSLKRGVERRIVSADEYFGFVNQIKADTLDTDVLLISSKNGPEFLLSDAIGMKPRFLQDTLFYKLGRTKIDHKSEYVEKRTRVHVSKVYFDPQVDWEYVFVKQVLCDDVFYGIKTYRYTFQNNKIIMVDEMVWGTGWVKNKETIIKRLSKARYVDFLDQPIEYIIAFPEVYLWDESIILE